MAVAVAALGLLPGVTLDSLRECGLSSQGALAALKALEQALRGAPNTVPPTVVSGLAAGSSTASGSGTVCQQQLVHCVLLLVLCSTSCTTPQ